MNLPTRKPLRLKDYDYSQNGVYFITICTLSKRKILWEDAVGTNCVRPNLSIIGNIINNEISLICSHYENITIDKYVIMPNHVHMMITIDLPESGRTQFAPTVSRIVKQFKGSVSKQIGYPIWHKSFHDRIIRDEADYERTWQYIDENPAKWAEDCYYTQ